MSTRLPRDVEAATLIRVLARFGYAPSRQEGSHIRLTTQRNGEHHLTVPAHSALRLGLLAAIIRDASNHLGVDREEIVKHLR